MKRIGNERGIALITALMFTVLGLVISMALLYSVTSGIRTSGALKRYRTATDAVYGGTDIVLKDILTTSFGFSDYSTANAGSSGKSFATYMSNSVGSLSTPSFSSCLRQRLTTPRTQWSGSCANTDLNPKNSTDISFNLNATSNAPYTVYSKIVDTMERKFTVLDPSGVVKTVVIAGNSDTSSLVLDGGSTTDGSGVSVPQYPYIYRVEIQGERQQNPLEKANISVLYAY